MITLVPAPTPVTSPVAVTVATPGVADTHGFVAAGVAEPVSWLVDPTQTEKLPVMVGAALTVTVAELLQPPPASNPLVSVMVIFTDPAPTPVISPELLTVAWNCVSEVQKFVAAGLDPVNWTVAPSQTVSVPKIVGMALTVTVAVMVHPPELV